VKFFLRGILFSLVASSAFAQVWPSGRPLTLAHRGANREFDENTLAAFHRAAELGADAVECDPKLTQDGVYVIMHDFTVDRTTNGHGKVSDLTLEQVRALRTRHGEPVPTLGEVLKLAHDSGLAVYLDMKTSPPDLGTSLIALLDQYQMRSRVIVGTYNKIFCRTLKQRWLDLTVEISWPWPVFTLEGAHKLGADSIGTLTALATKRIVSRAHRLHLHVATFPVDDTAKLQHQKDIGVDVLQTNDLKLLPK
jgi:glycerophosphoryl diester phosphodiesterase